MRKPIYGESKESTKCSRNRICQIQFRVGYYNEEVKNQNSLMIMKKKSDRKKTPWTSSFKIEKNVESLNERSDWKGIAVDGENRRTVIMWQDNLKKKNHKRIFSHNNFLSILTKKEFIISYGYFSERFLKLLLIN